jgi:hypothetical protein
MTTAAVLNQNQQEQTPVLGDIDLGIMMSGTISGILSVNQATALVAGAPVKFDTTITTGRLPQFVAAAQTDKAIGIIKRTLQAATFNAGDKIEVVGDFGPVMWLEATGTIACGAQVESDTTDAFVETLASGSQRGIAIDPASDGQLLRVMISNPWFHA